MDSKEAPPPYQSYPGNQGPPPQQGYPAGGYAYEPAPHGHTQYAPQPAGYAGPPAGYAGPPAGSYNPGYAPPATMIQVGSQPGMHTHTTTVYVERPVNHCLHCCISLFFPPWIFVWIFLCLTN